MKPEKTSRLDDHLPAVEEVFAQWRSTRKQTDRIPETYCGIRSEGSKGFAGAAVSFPLENQSGTRDVAQRQWHQEALPAQASPPKVISFRLQSAALPCVEFMPETSPMVSIMEYPSVLNL